MEYLFSAYFFLAVVQANRMLKIKLNKLKIETKHECTWLFATEAHPLKQQSCLLQPKTQLLSVASTPYICIHTIKLSHPIANKVFHLGSTEKLLEDNSQYFQELKKTQKFFLVLIGSDRTGTLAYWQVAFIFILAKPLSSAVSLSEYQFALQLKCV